MEGSLLKFKDMTNNSIYTFILFFILNFGALALGGLFTGSGVSSDWYANISKAPWTPPGWVFGAAWTLIMICFSFYMTQIFVQSENKSFVILLFAVQWILNVSWNPLFFYFQATTLSLISIVMLTVLVGYFLFHFKQPAGWMSLLIAPYFIWLLIATSLNAYISIYN